MTGFTTPWHCSVAQLADGRWVSGPMGEFSQDSRLELVHVDGKPSHYREKSHHKIRLPISEENASYLQCAKSISINQYKNGAFQMARLASSSSEISLSSSEGRMPDTAYTTPEIHSNRRSSSRNSGLNITFDKGLGHTARAEETKSNLSVPYGRRLIPQIMDNLAATEPERTVFSLASLFNGSLELKPVSARLFTGAVNKTASWLCHQVGIPSKILPVAYIGPRRFNRQSNFFRLYYALDADYIH